MDVNIWKRKTFCINILYFLIGLLFISIGINLTIVSQFGVGGWDAVQIAMTNTFGFSIGVWINIWAFLYLSICAILEKKRIRFECFLTSILLGLCIDIGKPIISLIQIHTMPLQAITFLIGLVIIALGAGIYLVPKFPPNPIDYLMVVLTQRFQISIRVAKWITEGVGCALAWFLKGPIGTGTILLLLFIGPCIQFFYKKAEQLYQHHQAS